MSKLQVFLSHLSIESRFADLLTGHLQRDFIGMLNVFVSSDSTSIPAGAQWFDTVVERLGQSQLHLVLCSEESVMRPWINYEAGAARLGRVPMVPMRHSTLTAAQLPATLGAAEGVMLTDVDGLVKLYARIAAMIDSDIPPADFDRYAEEFRALEEQYAEERRERDAASRRAHDESTIIRDPRVVCLTSDQFLDLGFKNQLQIVLDAFPQDLRHSQLRSSAELQDLVMTKSERVDIVHIAAFVCPRTGAVYFSPVDLATGRSSVAEVDLIPPDALAMLLTKAQTRLVVIASCESLALATSLLRVTNVIAGRDVISAPAMASWVETFYETLKTLSLAEACEYAFHVSHAQMTLLAQQTAMPELRFQPAT
jgi:hypothetical protein